MTPETLKQLLHQLTTGHLTIDQALVRLRSLPFEQLPHATIDHHRAIRCGHPEVIFCPGKTAAQIIEIAHCLVAAGSRVLATRINPDQLAAIKSEFPAAMCNEIARAVLIGASTQLSPIGPSIAVVSAGTSDAPVAEEALFTLQSMNIPTIAVRDVGVAGLHRLLSHVSTLQQCCALVVIAGMEGALPSVVGGLVAAPVFAVPTSVGYGLNLSGLTALLGMLNSCASNVTAVNIDNGFGAAFAAAMVHHQIVQGLRNNN